MGTADLVFKAIAHPTRRHILHLLSISTRSVKELTADFDLSQPAVSQHLKELRDADLVSSEKVGQEHRYRLEATPLKLVFDWTSHYRPFFDPAGHAWAFVKPRKPATALTARPKRGR